MSSAPRWIVRGLLLACSAVLVAAMPARAPVVALAAVATALALEWAIARVSPAEAAGALVGAFLGTLAADWLALGLFADLERLQPFVLLVGAYTGTVLGMRAALALPSSAVPPSGAALLLDTSALIDGRIAGVLASGLSSGPIVVPGFVLRELHAVADSQDPNVRARGRRGLETLERLRAVPAIDLRITDDDDGNGAAVDERLVRLARAHGHRLVTLDFNLAKIAEVRDVRVVNVNDLAKAARRPATPGDVLRLAVVRTGREPGQGVAYLDDGTMVVIENAADAVGTEAEVVVTGALPTAGGTLLFARLAGAPERHIE